VFVFFGGEGGPRWEGGRRGFKLLSFCVRKHCGRKRRVADKSGVINVVAEQLVVNLSFFFFLFFFPLNSLPPDTPPPSPFLCTSVGRVLGFERRGGYQTQSGY